MMEERRLEIPNDILIAEVKRVLAQGHTATIRVKGYSMRIFLENCRDVVKLAPIAPAKVKVRDVVLAEIAPRQYVLHRVICRRGHHLTLRGDGNIRGTEACLDTDVVGVVAEFYRKGRTRPDLASGLKWKIYSRVWLALSPVRRYILAVYRRLPHARTPR